MTRVLALALLFISTTVSAKVAPPFSGDLLAGGRLTLQTAMKKDRALLLCFWATWCVPCLEELKAVSAKLRDEKNLPVDLVTVNVDTSETASDVRPTLKLHNFEFPVILDPKHEIFTKYVVEKSLPYSVLISANGQISKSFAGYSEAMFNEVREAITK